MSARRPRPGAPSRPPVPSTPAWRAASWALAGALALSSAGHATACGKSEPAASPPPNKEEVAAKAAQAARAVRDYAFAQKDDLVQRMNGELVILRAALDDLSGKVERQGAAASAESKARLVTVRERWEKVKVQLELAKSARAENWDEFKAALSASLDDLDRSFHEARE